MFDLSDHNLLQEGITSKERVLRIMGSPTLVSHLESDESWIYYFENVRYLLFFYPEIKERSILVLKFDGSDVIKELRSLNLEDEDEKFAFVKKYTAVESHKTGFFKSIFSNVGQVKPQ
jgi:outer membrane protein assembly factor BamE (lipoprotein component of BamABCDE complex)